MNISSGGIVYSASHRVYGTSTVNISGGRVSTLHAYDTSTVNISGGEASDLYAWGSTMNISGGRVGTLSCGTVTGGLWAYGTSTVNISGGTPAGLYAYGNSTMNISGGVIGELGAANYSTITLFGYDFGLSGNLSWAPDGERILGTGLLTGKWFDDTSFIIPITSHDNTATIMAIPEPATLLLFGLGGLTLRRKMRR